MLGLDILFIGVGVWLLYSGIRVGRRKSITFYGSPFRWLRNKRHTPKVQAERGAPRVTKFSITRAPETPVDPRDHTLIIPRRRFVPETTITAPFERLAENTYRLEEGFLCGPISFGDVIETEPTEQEKVLLFRRRIKRRDFRRRCYVIPHRLVEDSAFRALAVEIQKSGGFASVDFKGLFLVFLPKKFESDIAIELDKIIKAPQIVPPTSMGEPT